MNALEIRQLRKTYDNGQIALRGIDLHVQEGDFFALLGPNGAGKSTTIGIISSLVTRTSGDIAIFDYDLDTHLYDAKSCLGIVPQEINFSLFESSLDIVLNQAGYYGIDRKLAMQRAGKYLKQLGLWDIRKRNSRTLSGGFKRRLMIARALIHEPRILILDEPTAGVDVELRRSMWSFLRELNRQGTTIVLTTHYLEEAESLCRNIAIIDHGSIIEHTSMRQLLSRLNVETFILDLEKRIEAPPSSENYRFQLVEPDCLEVEIEKNQNINRLFEFLSEQKIPVRSMRTKSNRLEELFIRLLENKVGKHLD